VINDDDDDGRREIYLTPTTKIIVNPLIIHFDFKNLELKFGGKFEFHLGFFQTSLFFVLSTLVGDCQKKFGEGGGEREKPRAAQFVEWR
jgi:hypothetical protein